MSMIIPEPKFEQVRYNLQGLSWWQQLLRAWKTPPRLRLTEDWVLQLADGLTIIIPAGFETDGASVPRLLWFLMPPFGVLLKGAILHDFGYQHGYLLAVYVHGNAYNLRSHEMHWQYNIRLRNRIPVYIGQDQRFFDGLFKKVVIETTGAAAQATIAYAMLRCFGDLAWMRYRVYGPGAYNSNSLNLPGLDSMGSVLDEKN